MSKVASTLRSIRPSPVIYGLATYLATYLAIVLTLTVLEALAK